ncbi:MAG TPA: dephospho-CoA kinase [Candidatus Goldiibacteriota bacterium]|nr:dephospho-CoA kinase [Candidatus Goldiibacteriota bacterium]
MNVDKKFIVGITGLVKSGKTTVAEYLKKHGFYVINVDKFAHSLYKKNTLLYKKLIKIFGRSILKTDLNIDRKKLSSIAFSSRSIYNKFCSLVYPSLNYELEKKIKNSKNDVIIIDMAVLFESGFYKKTDYIVFVNISRKNWLKRIKNHSNSGFIKKAFIYQNVIKISKKIALSNYIIYNNGSKKELYNQTVLMSEKIKEILWTKKMKN